MATQVSLNSGAVASAGTLALQTNGTTAAVTIDASQNVGVGTASPSTKLDVAGTINSNASINVTKTGSDSVGSGPYFYLNNGASGTSVRAWATQLGASSSMDFWNYDGSSWTKRMTLDASGTLGLGVTPSTTTAKHIQGPASFFMGPQGDGFYLMSNAYYNSGFKYATTDVASYYSQSAGQHRWYNAASGTAGNAITFTQAMTLNASSNLQLGTTTVSAARLNVFSSDVNKQIVFSNNETYYGSVAHNAGTGMNEYRTEATGGHAFFKGTESTAGMTFDSSGNLLVGTTTTNQSHRIVGVTANSYTTEFFNSYASQNYGIDIKYTAAAPNGTGNQFLQCDDNAATRLTVRSNGGIANYSANNVNLSDRREKTNFAPAGDYLAKICAIPVQTFNYIDQNLEEDDGLTLGVVAQDVQAVAPELVMESNWAGKDEEPKMRLSIYQTDLQYALMKCIQEQQALITQLQADVAALKGA